MNPIVLITDENRITCLGDPEVVYVVYGIVIYTYLDHVICRVIYMTTSSGQPE